MRKKVEISYRSIVLTILTLAGIWIFYLIRYIIMEFFVALIIMAFLNPYVTKLSKYKIPRGFSVLLVYLLLIAVVSFSLGTIMPSLVEQSTSIINNFPEFINNWSLSERFYQSLSPHLAALPGGIAKLTISVFSNLLNVFTVLVIAYYFLSERDKLDDQLGVFMGSKTNEDKAGKIIDNLERQLGNWARGQLGLMLIVGVLSYGGYRLLGIPFPLALAILSGVLEIVPYMGPILAAVPAVIIGFGISPLMGIAAASLAFLIQQVENYLLVPKIMKRASDVNPIVTLLSLAVGFKLAGVIGLLISVPVFITARVLAKEFLLQE